MGEPYQMPSASETIEDIDQSLDGPHRNLGPGNLWQWILIPILWAGLLVIAGGIVAHYVGLA